MAITYPIPDQNVLDKIELNLQEFEKLRIGYIDPYLTDEEKEIKIERVNEIVENNEKNKKKSFFSRFFFSDYE